MSNAAAAKRLRSSKGADAYGEESENVRMTPSQQMQVVLHIAIRSWAFCFWASEPSIILRYRNMCRNGPNIVLGSAEYEEEYGGVMLFRSPGPKHKHPLRRL